MANKNSGLNAALRKWKKMLTNVVKRAAWAEFHAILPSLTRARLSVLSNYCFGTCTLDVAYSANSRLRASSHMHWSCSFTQAPVKGITRSGPKCVQKMCVGKASKFAWSTKDWTASGVLLQRRRDDQLYSLKTCSPTGEAILCF